MEENLLPREVVYITKLAFTITIFITVFIKGYLHWDKYISFTERMVQQHLWGQEYG